MKALLLSGGNDSALLAATIGYDRALFFDYGQPHVEEEQAAAECVAERYGLELENIWLPDLGMTAENFVVPHRNMLFLTTAAALGCTEIHIGANATDEALFPDCRESFFVPAGAALPGVTVVTPLLHMTKTEIMEQCRELHVPVDNTWTCYNPQRTEFGVRPCAACTACMALENL